MRVEDRPFGDLPLSGTNRDPFSGEIQGMPPMDSIEENFETYFYITEKGLFSEGLVCGVDF